MSGLGPPLELYRRKVEHMVETEIPFGQVEQAIDETELAPDQRDALWMLAWSLMGPDDPQPPARRKPELVLHD